MSLRSSISAVFLLAVVFSPSARSVEVSVSVKHTLVRAEGSAIDASAPPSRGHGHKGAAVVDADGSGNVGPVLVQEGQARTNAVDVARKVASGELKQRLNIFLGEMKDQGAASLLEELPHVPCKQQFGIAYDELFDTKGMTAWDCMKEYSRYKYVADMEKEHAPSGESMLAMKMKDQVASEGHDEDLHEIITHALFEYLARQNGITLDDVKESLHDVDGTHEHDDYYYEEHYVDFKLEEFVIYLIEEAHHEMNRDSLHKHVDEGTWEGEHEEHEPYAEEEGQEREHEEARRWHSDEDHEEHEAAHSDAAHPGEEEHEDHGHGDEWHGDEEHEDEDHGYHEDGDEVHADEVHGDEEHGDESYGDETHGDEEHGDESYGDEEHGDEEHGDEEHGDEEHNEHNEHNEIGQHVQGDVIHNTHHHYY